MYGIACWYSIFRRYRPVRYGIDSLSHDCPLAICHKKGSTQHVDRGSFCFRARLYLGAQCILFWLLMYLFFSFDVFIIYGLYMLGRDIMFYVPFIVSCFTYVTFVINLYYEVFHGICIILCFVKSRIYFVLLVFSTHAFICLLSVSGIYRLIQSWLLSTLATDRQQLG